MVYQHEINVAQRNEKSLGIIFFDIDHFKDVNDPYGHLAGDRVLQESANMVRQRLRRRAIVARWGGEECVILLPETELDEAINVAEMLRSVISEKYFEAVGSITCSFGVALLEENDVAEHLLNRADQLLYEAKNSGRNKVIY
jgi:diguanylate cyclase (GGDEF)-like protein